MRILALFAALAPAAAASAPLEPVPAACTAALSDTVREDLSAREMRVKELAARVRSEKSLFVAQARAAFVQSGLGRYPEQSLGGRDPFSYAERLEALRPRLAPQGWSRGVALWADWLEASERAWERDDSLIPVAPHAAASGVISLGLDVVTFVPSMALSTGKRLSQNAHIRRSARAFRRFADFVESRERD